MMRAFLAICAGGAVAGVVMVGAALWLLTSPVPPVILESLR
jgi:hypothetical protein